MTKGVSNLKKGFLLGLGVLALVGCSEPEPQSEVVADDELAVSRDSYAGDWPFTAESGVLGCTDRAVYFKTTDETYALSGFSRTYSDNKGLGWIPVTPEQTFWLDNPEIEGTKISVSNMVSDATALCA